MKIQSYVCSARKPPVSCDIWFESISEISKKQLQHYDLIGIGSLTNTIEEAYSMAAFLKKNNKIVVMGGPHVSFRPEEALEYCDYVVIGEGELTFLALVKALSNSEDPSSIQGLAYRLESGEMRITPKAKLSNIAKLPSPDFLLSPQVSSKCSPRL